MNHPSNPYGWCTVKGACCPFPGHPLDPREDHCPCHSEPEFHGVITLMRQVRRNRRYRAITSVLLGMFVGASLGYAMSYAGTVLGMVLFSIAGIGALGIVAFHVWAFYCERGERTQLVEAARTIERLLERT